MDQFSTATSRVKETKARRVPPRSKIRHKKDLSVLIQNILQALVLASSSSDHNSQLICKTMHRWSRYNQSQWTLLMWRTLPETMLESRTSISRDGIRFQSLRPVRLDTGTVVIRRCPWWWAKRRTWPRSRMRRASRAWRRVASLA